MVRGTFLDFIKRRDRRKGYAGVYLAEAHAEARSMWLLLGLSDMAGTR